MHFVHAFVFVFVHTVEINDRSVESDPLNNVLCMQPRGETLQQTKKKGQRCRWTAAAGARHARLKPVGPTHPSLAERDVHVCQLRDR